MHASHLAQLPPRFLTAFCSLLVSADQITLPLPLTPMERTLGLCPDLACAYDLYYSHLLAVTRCSQQCFILQIKKGLERLFPEKLLSVYS